jgi:hypothetical protein
LEKSGVELTWFILFSAKVKLDSGRKKRSYFCTNWSVRVTVMLLMLLFTVLNYLVTKLNLHVCHSTCCNQVVKYYCLLVTHSIIQMNLKFLYLLLHSMIFNRQLLTNSCCVFEFTSTSCPRSLFDLVSNNRIKCVIWCFFIGRFSHKDKGNPNNPVVILRFANDSG